MKYPIGVQDFKSIREDGYVYVDKTALVYDMVTSGKIYFLNRPRRFGKSLLVSTLKYYFEGQRDLFDGLAISQLVKNWKKYPVFHLDFNGSSFQDSSALYDMLLGFVASYERVYGGNPDAITLGDRFAGVLHAAHAKTGLRAVVLVDEYDKPILDVLDTRQTVDAGTGETYVEDYNREVLKGFYSVFKKADADLKFVLLTGVTKFSQVSVFSGFNQPNDISMVSKYDALCGITDDELTTVFADSIRELAATLGFSEQEMKAELRRHYDGYNFSRRMTGIYNPFSLLKAFDNQNIGDYWFQSGTPSYLVRLLNHCNENLNEMVGRYYDPQEFIDYKADVEKPLPMIYQSGYLTIKDYDSDLGQYKLDLPNDEVAKGFVSLLSADYLKTTDSPIGACSEMVRALKGGDANRFRDVLAAFLSSIPYSARRKANERERERYFQYTIYLIMRLISVYTISQEKETSQGRADFVVETPKFIYIFEFKLDRSASEALEQIEARGYTREFALDKRTLFKIGCSFSSVSGTISDWVCKINNI